MPFSRSHPRHARSSAPVAALVSLGCAKNTVDSERILAQLVLEGFQIAEEAGDADICLVNTCGFIAEAREETEATLNELARGRSTGHPRRIVALGCLVERAAQVPELQSFLAQADARIGFGDYLRLGKICRELLQHQSGEVPAEHALQKPLDPGFYRSPRMLTGSPHCVSLKISEGCSHACSFCTIPRIRGPQASRPAMDIVAEAHELIASGAREIMLIGQDTTSYGRDLTGHRELASLIRILSKEISHAEGLKWLRLMYAYPRFLGEDVLEAMEEDERWRCYLDLPLQHISNRMLRAMGRGMNGEDTRRLIGNLQARKPGYSMRTAFIVGHPGETDSDFNELLDFVKEGHFMHVGVFAYSPETGTASIRQPDPVPSGEAEERKARLMEAQREVSSRRLAEMTGRSIEVMLDEPVARGVKLPVPAKWIARHGGQARDIDGATILTDSPRKNPAPGDVITVQITGHLDYDLVARCRRS